MNKAGQADEALAVAHILGDAVRGLNLAEPLTDKQIAEIVSNAIRVWRELQIQLNQSIAK